MVSDISLTICDSVDDDEGVVRLDQSDMRFLGVQTGDLLTIKGSQMAYARVLPAYMEDRNQRLARVHPLMRRNVGVDSGQKVEISASKIEPAPAEVVTIETRDDLDALYIEAQRKQVQAAWNGHIVSVDQWLCAPFLDRHPLETRIVETRPTGPVRISGTTNFVIKLRADSPPLPAIGGLREIYRSCQFMAEDRLKNKKPMSAKAVLLLGPSGCGKAHLVTRLAEEMGAGFLTLDAHALLDKRLAQRGGELDVSLTALAKRGPTIVLLDHLEVLTPGERDSSSLTEAQRAVLAQFCALLDEIPTQPNVMLFGVASGSVHPRLKSHHVVDLIIPVDAPNRFGRYEILKLATQGVPLSDNIDLVHLSALTAGSTARDLQQLVASASFMATGSKVTEDDFIYALRSIQPSARSEVTCDVPTTSWDDVAGLEDIKQLLRETLSWTLRARGKFSDVGVRMPHSVLLAGGVGTGKTSLVRALASQTLLNFIEIACPLFTAREPLEAARFIHDAFSLARRKTPCLLFFDEIDVLFDVNAEENLVPRFGPAVAQLLADLDAMSTTYGVVVIAATNRPDRLTIDILRPGRFDFAVTLPMPDKDTRKDIFQIHARKLPLAADINFDDLASATQGFSPAEITNLCNRVGLMALRQSLNSDTGGVIPPVVNAALFEQALRGKKN